MKAKQSDPRCVAPVVRGAYKMGVCRRRGPFSVSCRPHCWQHARKYAHVEARFRKLVRDYVARTRPSLSAALPVHPEGR